MASKITTQQLQELSKRENHRDLIMAYVLSDTKVEQDIYADVLEKLSFFRGSDE